MKYLPDTENALVLRTDFSNDEVWRRICQAIQEPIGEFMAYVDIVSDPDFSGISEKLLFSIIPAKFNHSYIFIIDQVTITNPENPLLVIDLYSEPGRTFRVIPSEIQGVENNLSIANMDFCEFADNTDSDGVFRGFKR